MRPTIAGWAKSVYDAEDFCHVHDKVPFPSNPSWSRPGPNVAALPIPQSQEENDQITSLMPGKNIWLGIGSTSRRAWGVSDDPIYTNWRSDEGTEKRWAFISSADGKWVRADESEMHDVICLFRF